MIALYLCCDFMVVEKVILRFLKMKKKYEEEKYNFLQYLSYNCQFYTTDTWVLVFHHCEKSFEKELFGQFKAIKSYRLLLQLQIISECSWLQPSILYNLIFHDIHVIFYT